MGKVGKVGKVRKVRKAGKVGTAHEAFKILLGMPEESLKICSGVDSF